MLGDGYFLSKCFDLGDGAVFRAVVSKPGVAPILDLCAVWILSGYLGVTDFPPRPGSQHTGPKNPKKSTPVRDRHAFVAKSHKQKRRKKGMGEWRKIGLDGSRSLTECCTRMGDLPPPLPKHLQFLHVLASSTTIPSLKKIKFRELIKHNG